METIVFDKENNQSLALEDNKQIGECQFEVKDNTWYITHTGVCPEFGGRGIAKKLVLKVIEEARKTHAKIVPICSYAAKMMIDNPDYKDVLK